MALSSPAQPLGVQTPPAAHSPTPGMGMGEMGFLLLLVLALACVFLFGRWTYKEASRLQHAKDNGLAVLQWASDLAASGDGRNKPRNICAKTSPDDTASEHNSAPRWADCREQLLAEHGDLAGLHNPFDAQVPVFAAACERGQAAHRGTVVLEKGTASPPGFPPTVSYAPLSDEEVLSKGLMLRVLVCDPSGRAVHVGEVKL